LVVVDGKRGGRPAQAVFGFVFLDDYYARVVAVGTEIEDTVQKLVESDHHLLGHARRRRFSYPPPPGWPGEGALLETPWYPLDHPRNAARITVCPALPAVAGLSEALIAQVTDRAIPDRPVVTLRAGSLAGARRHLIVADAPQGMDTYLGLLSDGTFV